MLDIGYQYIIPGEVKQGIASPYPKKVTLRLHVVKKG